MLNTKKNKIKNIIFSIILCLGMFVSALSGINIVPNYQVFAGTNNIINDVSSTLLSSYYNFSTTSTAKPATPNGWSEISDNVVNEDNIIKGIVDVKDETTFNTSTYKTTRPKMPKDQSTDTSYFKNLMINSYNGAGRLGYKSNSFTLEADSFYSISVMLYTHRTEKTDTTEETDPTASIYLTGLTDDESLEYNTKFENINTLTSWETYTFYVDTDTSKSVNLELWLGSKTDKVQGAVFFNNIQILRYSEDYYVENILPFEDTTDNKFNIISLSQSTTQPVINSSFETTTPLGWNKIAQGNANENDQRCEIVDVNNFSLEINDTKIKAPGSNNSSNNTQTLFMYNKESSYQAIESSIITINKLSYYQISFWAKSDCNVGTGATVYLVDKSETNPISNAKLTLTTTYTSNSNEYRNDWTKYSFYVYGDDLEDKSVTIQIWLGTTDSKTSGYVFIDDFRMKEIDYQTYSNNSSSTNSSALNFNADSDKFVIVNSDFNKTSNEDSSTTYPLTPSSWTKEGNTNNNTYSGIINANVDHFNANIDNYSNGLIIPTRPANHPVYKDNNNVLMIGSTSENNSQSYKSSDISLSANSYYKLSFYVFTDYYKINKQDNFGARVKLSTSVSTLFDYYNIYFEDNTWHQFVVYIKTGTKAETANLYLMFENLTGYVYFDDIRLETSSETIFNNFTKNPEIIYSVVDLSYENFDNRTFNFYSELQTPNNWTATEQDNIEVTSSGIINISSDKLSDIPPTLSGNQNVLYIQSLHDVNYSYKTKENFTLSSATYYKLTVNILTRNIITENSQDYVDYGASIGFSDTQDIFITGINTNGEWKTYTIYICLEEEKTSKITLGLGFNDQKTSGEVLFDNLKLETIDKATFDEEIKASDNNLTKSFINYQEPTDTTSDEPSDWTNEFNWLILPSIFTALAIIIAIVGFYIKKINFTKKPKIKTKYDRRKTLDKDIDRREKIALRQQIIDELNAELLSIDKEIEEYNKLADEKLEEIKNQINVEKEEIKRQKLELEIKKKEAKNEREKQLKNNPELISNTKAEKEFVKFMANLDKQEMKLQKALNLKDLKLENVKEADKSRIAKYLERKEFIKNEIAKIEAEIEEIAKEEAEMWEEYKRAKLDAKRRKAEYKAQLKAEKENKKISNSKKGNKNLEYSSKTESDSSNIIDQNSDSSYFNVDSSNDTNNKD